MVVKESNRKKRVSWCRAMRNWTAEENWKKRLFSDELQVVGTSNFVYIWRKENEVNNPNLECPALRREASILVWGCVSYGIRTLCHVEGTINAQ